jgi:hypothetical protein
MSQAAAVKAKRDTDEDAPAKPAPAPQVPSLIHTGIISVTAICCSALLGYAGITMANLVLQHPAPAPIPAPYVIAEGSNGMIWRMNSQTGELLACRSTGPTGIIPNDPDGAGCWRVGQKGK